MKKILTTLLVISVYTGAYAQESEKPTSPKTKVEAFSEQYGDVYIKGFAEIGTVKGTLGTTLVVESREVISAANGKKEYGITLEVKEYDRYPKSHTSYIDYDEIPSLIKGLEYISKVNKSATKLNDFQADYRTKDDLRISAFSDGEAIKMSVVSGSIGATRAYFKIDDAQKILDLIKAAKQKIDSIK